MSGFLGEEYFNKLECRPRGIVREYMTPELFVHVLKGFQHKKLMEGEQGGMAIMQGVVLYITPSSLSFEALHSRNVFKYNIGDKSLLQYSPEYPISLYADAYTFLLYRTEYGTIIHTYSENCAQLMESLKDRGHFEISYHESIKGVWDCQTEHHKVQSEDMRIPILDCEEEPSVVLSVLEEYFTVSFNIYPATLVRNHGLFVWAPNWEVARTMAESFENLFAIGLRMKDFGYPLKKERNNNVCEEYRSF